MLWPPLDRLRHRARMASMAPHEALGAQGEDLAHRFLQRQGYRVIARNFVTRSGQLEIDLVAWDKDDEGKDQLVFVEVKTRVGNQYSRPEERIDQDKIDRTLRAGHEFCVRADVDFKTSRIDFVSVVIGSGQPEVRLFRDALQSRRSTVSKAQ